MTPEEITFAVIALVMGGIGWRNPTCVALALSYLLPKALILSTGYAFGIEGLFRIDLAIIAAIYILKRGTPHPWCRKAHCDDGYPYRSFAHHICSFWLERTPWDRFVILCFPAAWWFYGVQNEGVQWWGLISIWLAQLGASFWEALDRLYHRRAANAVSDSPGKDSSGVEYAWAHGGGGDG